MSILLEPLTSIDTPVPNLGYAGRHDTLVKIKLQSLVIEKLMMNTTNHLSLTWMVFGNKWDAVVEFVSDP